MGIKFSIFNFQFSPASPSEAGRAIFKKFSNFKFQIKNSCPRQTGFTVIKRSEASSNGFTVIELLIAVSIVVMLGTLVLANFVEQPKKGRDGKRKADLLQVRGALESYNDDKGCYPPSLPVCGEVFPVGSATPYLKGMPCDPKTGEGYTYVPEPTGTCPISFWLYAKLEYGKDPGIETVGCAPGCGPGNAYNFKIGSPNAQ